MPFDRCYKHHLRQVVTLEKKFSQGKGMAQLEDDTMRARVDGGYCFGAAMCWLKITLDKESLNYASAIDHLKPAHVQSMAMGHVLHGRAQDRAATKLRDAALENVGALRNTIEERRQNKVDKAIQEAKAEMAKASQKYSDDYSAHSANRDLKGMMDKVVACLDYTFNETERRVQQKLDEATQRAQAKADKRQEAISPNVTKEEVMKEAWRILEQVENRRYTGDITPVKRIEPDGVLTVGDFVSGVVGAPAFMAGRGMIVSFETGKAATTEPSVLTPPGHAIALYRVDANKYWLFEPNLGVFVVDGRTNLIYALVLIMADGYDKRIPGDDSAIVFCKTARILPDQGNGVIDTGVMVDRDKAKSAMKERLLKLTQNAFDLGLEALRAKQGGDEPSITAANKAMQDAFLRARVASAATAPSKLLDAGSTGSTFMKNRGRIGDTGLNKLYESIDGIF